MSVQDKIGLTSSKYDQTLLVICSVALRISLDTCHIKGCTGFAQKMSDFWLISGFIYRSSTIPASLVLVQNDSDVTSPSVCPSNAYWAVTVKQ